MEAELAALDQLIPISSVRFGEAKTDDTPQPAVVMQVITAAEERPYALSADGAELIGRQLLSWAVRARERHWDPVADTGQRWAGLDLVDELLTEGSAAARDTLRGADDPAGLALEAMLWMAGVLRKAALVAGIDVFRMLRDMRAGADEDGDV